MLLTLCYYSCQNNKKHNNQPSIDKEEYVSNKVFLETYFSTIDIPYLLKEEKDSILNNKERIATDKNYRNQFISKARGRRSGIRKLSGGVSHIPAPFKRYLLPSELTSFNRDSLSDLIVLYELYKKRQDKIRSISKYHLTYDEIQKLIKGSYKDSIYYRALSANRYKKDSIESIIRMNNKRDSLQKIIYPIDSVSPFGPKPLG